MNAKKPSTMPPAYSGPGCIAVLDFGTGGGKCVLFDTAGEKLASIRQVWSFARATSEYDSLTPGFTFDPDGVWNILVSCLREALRSSGVDPGAVIGVTTTSLRLGTVFLDAHGEELYCAPNLDGRGFGGALELLKSCSREKILATTGHWPPFLSTAARWIAFQKKNPQAEIAHVLSINDWLGFRLTGEIRAEPSNAAESFLLDVAERKWSTELQNAAAIPRASLPRLEESGTCIGKINSERAAEMGLEVGTPVFIAGADTQCALLGSGVIEPNSAGSVLGTTAPVMGVTDQPFLDPEGRVWSGCHVLPDRWTTESNAGESGASWDWILALLGLEGADRYHIAEQLMGEAGPEPLPVISFAHSQVFDLNNYNPNRIVGFGFPQSAYRGPIGPSRGQVLRSLIQNIAFAIRANLEQIGTVWGENPKSLTISGGLSQSRTLQAELKRTLRVPLQRSAEPEATALGAAILASVGSGAYPDLAIAVAAMVRLAPLPDCQELKNASDQEYETWQRTYAATKAISV